MGLQDSVDVAVVGAGPYGLSIAAHLQGRGVEHRIFGKPMDSWRAHMPQGMFLKSDGFASNLSDPAGALTLRQYCSEQRIPYADAGLPVALDTFSGYGIEFQKRMAPGLEQTTVESVRPAPQGFRLRLATGETAFARRVALAVGITHFAHIPPEIAHLSSELASHSFAHRRLERFKGRSVVVLGGGSSALDLAGLLHEMGAEVTLIARRRALNFHTKALSPNRPLWQRLRHPKSGLGPGLRSRFYANAPGMFHYLPESLRLRIVRRTLGPSGGWFIREKVIGRVPLILGTEIQRASVQDYKVRLEFRGADGKPFDITADHVIAATGYRPELARLPFLDETLRARIDAVHGAPVVSTAFESSVPGLYFVGLSAANSFGPVMRFAFGADFAARTVARALARSSRAKTAAMPRRAEAVAQ